jgi:hypothetical protein
VFRERGARFSSIGESAKRHRFLLDTADDSASERKTVPNPPFFKNVDRSNSGDKPRFHYVMDGCLRGGPIRRRP